MKDGVGQLSPLSAVVERVGAQQATGLLTLFPRSWSFRQAHLFFSPCLERRAFFRYPIRPQDEAEFGPLHNLCPMRRPLGSES